MHVLHVSWEGAWLLRSFLWVLRRKTAWQSHSRVRQAYYSSEMLCCRAYKSSLLWLAVARTQVATGGTHHVTMMRATFPALLQHLAGRDLSCLTCRR